MNYKTDELNYDVWLDEPPILIVDGVMGCGKTSAMISYINNAPDDTHFIYITPFLTEVERIKTECKNKKFLDPLPKNTRGSKLEGFKYLLSEGKNIVTTHALFSLLGKEDLDLAKFNNYILVMDEVANVIEPVDISTQDFDSIFKNNKFAHIDENGKVIWDAIDYTGDYLHYKINAENGALYVYNDIVFLWTFPIDIFKSFMKNFIITYMFNGQIQSAYYDLYNLDYSYVKVLQNEAEDYSPSNYYFEDKLYIESIKYPVNQYKNLFNICDSQKLNVIGDKKGALSKTWYIKNSKSGTLNILKNNLFNYFNNYAKCKLFLWTTFEDYRNILNNKRLGRSFLSCNSRATNDYIKKKNLAYLVNRFPNPIISNFFLSKEIFLDQDKYALSEMLQWIFRSQIREKKEINLYIPSRRMRELLVKWMNEEEIYENKEVFKEE